MTFSYGMILMIVIILKNPKLKTCWFNIVHIHL